MNKKNRTIIIGGETFHLNKEIPRDAENLHHIIGRVNRIKYNTNEKLNKVLLNERKHVALNRLFLDHQSPHEQLRDMVKIREPVLSEGVRETLYGLLSLPRGIFYKEELVKKKYLDKELFSDEESQFLKEDI